MDQGNYYDMLTALPRISAKGIHVDNQHSKLLRRLCRPTSTPLAAYRSPDNHSCLRALVARTQLATRSKKPN